jgi:signal transduction histidine kinase
VKYPQIMLPRDNIHLRLFIPYSISMIVAIIFAWWIATNILTTSLERRLDGQLFHATSVLAKGDIPYTKALLHRLGKLLRARFVLITAAGTVDISDLTLSEQTLIPTAIKIWNNDPLSIHSVTIYNELSAYRLVIHPLNPSQDNRYVSVAAFAPLDDVRAAANEAAWWLGTAALLGIVILAWVGHQLTRSITSPVRELADMADRISAGDRNVRSSIDQKNELGMLANALNIMTEHLEIYEHEIAEHNRLTALGEMAARIAHEIRNPLTAIKMQIQLLAESPGTEAISRIQRLQDELRRLELIVSTTLAFGRDHQPNFELYDLNKLITEVVELINPQLEHNNILLEIQLEKLPSTLLDCDKVKQILFNIVMNSVDALNDGGKILIHTLYNPKRLEIIVHIEDSGMGVSKELKNKLFSGPVTSKSGNLGVGLMLSRELIELHKGLIEVDDSTTLGGARFSAHFPVISKVTKSLTK